MKHKLLTALVITLPVVLLGCKDKVDLPDQPLSDYIQIYMPQAVNGPATFNFSTMDTVPATIVYGADYGGFGFPKKDLTVHFDIASEVVDSFNLANRTNYTLLPPKSYKMSGMEAVIENGKVSTTPLEVTIATSGENIPDDISQTYILPIRIKSAPVKVNPDMRTYFCIINIIPTFFDRSEWKIIGFDSQESVGEGPNNGRAIFALDGDIKTFWHSQWKDAQPGPPHYITIDMGESKRVLGSAFVARQNVNSGRPQDIQIFISENNTDWKEVFKGTLINTGDIQKVFFEKAMNARYIKLQINSSFSSNLTHLAEFYMF